MTGIQKRRELSETLRCTRFSVFTQKSVTGHRKPWRDRLNSTGKRLGILAHAQPPTSPDSNQGDPPACRHRQEYEAASRERIPRKETGSNSKCPRHARRSSRDDGNCSEFHPVQNHESVARHLTTLYARLHELDLTPSPTQVLNSALRNLVRMPTLPPCTRALTTRAAHFHGRADFPSPTPSALHSSLARTHTRCNCAVNSCLEPDSTTLTHTANTE